MAASQSYWQMAKAWLGGEEEMKITELNIYPVKSLRGISLPSASLCAQGLANDRRYILLKPCPNGNYKSMFVGSQPEMALFHCSLSSPTSFWVEYRTPSPPLTPPTPSQQTKLEIPFETESATLEKVQVEIHTDPNYPAYRMPGTFNTWFSECFGYEVILAYLGDGHGVKKEDEKAQEWISAMQRTIPTRSEDFKFSDGAALLVCNETSLLDLHPQLNGEKAIMEKFRPNIVIEGPSPWNEDFWGELTLPRTGSRIVLTTNCLRCTSINIDLDKGRMGSGESGKLLKKMMRDRRVDPGNKWTPVFGRYGFPTCAGEIEVGDKVVVSVRNSEHSVWNGINPRLSTFERISV